MRKVDKPDIMQEDICNCFRGFTYKDRILEKSQEYDDNFLQVALFLQEESSFLNQDSNYNSYLVSVYENRLSKKNSPSYKYYEKIRGKIKCPYCNFTARDANELDHYLPKSHFPTFAVTANNLVPICGECNRIKDDHYNTDISKMLIHPYYDQEIERMLEFLKCKIVEDMHIGFEFFIEKLPGWSNIFFERVKYHFSKLEIDKLYQSDFGAEFNVKIQELKILFNETGDIQDVKKSLQRRAKALSIDRTRPWEYVGLISILENNWFFDTYFPEKCSGNI
ncbi:HNH endonuclease [Paenibacillus sp. NPDC093718]|uniref:HNH endonuclease n=1 Tax=Paenibacillus sp. NPDC093718 TaxID=3390601 RepID=UPI003D0079F9